MAREERRATAHDGAPRGREVGRQKRRGERERR
jgi:hypothetical protein